jgi:hypothetical protein
VVLICISFIARDGEHFSCVFWPFEFLLFEKLMFSSLAHFFIGSLVLGEFSFISSLYILVVYCGTIHNSQIMETAKMPHH